MSHGNASEARAARSDLLDLVRTVAIVLVVFFHVAVRQATPADEIGMVEEFFYRWGSKGVDIFFPLSGFLITGFLLTSKRPDFGKVFFLRRLFRIVPLYFAACLLAMLGMYVTGTETYLLDRFWINFTFLTAWFIHFQGPEVVPYTITWSLSVEEFAYILLGLMALIWRKALPAFLFAITVLAIAMKYHLISQETGFYFLPVARLDSIAIGGITAWLMATRRIPLLWLGLAVILATILGTLDANLQDALSLTKLALITCMVIVISETWLKGLGNKVTSLGASIGFYSYFTYLFHIFTIDASYMIVAKSLDIQPSFWVMAFLSLGLTHIAAMVSYRVFEGPVMRFGRSLEAPGALQNLPLLRRLR